MITLFDDGDALARGAAELFVAQALEAITARQVFSVLLAGGATPRRTYQLLAKEPYISQLPWECVHFSWGDERCVPFEDPRNNALMAHKALLAHLPIQPEQIHALPCTLSPQEAADAYQVELETFFNGKPPSFDLALLGLGSDGHTASLLPESAALDEQQKWTAVTRYIEEDFSRVTLTVPILNQARVVLFMVVGRRKAQVVKDVLSRSNIKSPYPAQLIQPVSGDVRWFLDREAASMLDEKNVSIEQ